jgi:hypothetical protein
MSEPTTAEIQEQHDQDEADWENAESQAQGMRNDPDCDLEVAHDEQPESHIHRGLLLERLEAAEAKLKAVGDSAELWHTEWTKDDIHDVADCATVIKALLKEKSDE